MTKVVVAKGLSEPGVRELTHFLASHLQLDKLRNMSVSAWEADISFEGMKGHLEIGSHWSKSGNPVTRTFDGDEIEVEEVEVDDE